MSNVVVEKMEIDNDVIRISLTVDKEKLFDKDYDLSYYVIEEIRRNLAPILAKEIVEKNKDMIVEQVLSAVNWPDVVRSEIAQQVIQAIAQKPRNNY